VTSESSVHVRTMTEADLARVGTLAGRLVRMHHDFDRQRFLAPVDPEKGYARWFATQLADARTLLLVAEDAAKAEVVGYVYARLEPRSYNELLDACCRLHDVYVDDQARRRGIGEALLRETARLAKQKGAPRIVLMTATQNEAAQRLFARFGFRSTMIEMTRETT
jgi:ribosomal protein S18 acetylase RimI-like enzyme